MKAGIGRLTAELAEKRSDDNEYLVALINERIKPPTPVATDEVYIRVMYIVSDEVNSFGGRFPHDEHRELIHKLIDSPVLIGHRKDSLPIARTFHAEPVRRDNRNWVKSYFYWSKSDPDAESLREKIDSGVVTECSISFSFRLPECSACGRDIRLCEHEPFQTITQGGVRTTVYFNYRQIDKVLETSLVYRGAVKNTKIEKLMEDIDGLSPESTFLITPRYDGIPVRANIKSGQLQVTDYEGEASALSLTSSLQCDGWPDISSPAVIVGYRGKERVDMERTTQFLDGKSSGISRIVLFVLPDCHYEEEPPPIHRHPIDVRVIPHRIGTGDAIKQLASEITTRDGVNVWSWPLVDNARPIANFHPDQVHKENNRGYWLFRDNDNGNLSLRLSSPVHKIDVSVSSFDSQLLKEGRLFLVDRALSQDTSVRSGTDGKILSVVSREDGYQLRLSGELAGEYVLRPIILRGDQRFIFYRSNNKAIAS